MNYLVLFNIICRILIESPHTEKSISEGEIFVSYRHGIELTYVHDRHGLEQLTIRWFGTVTNRWVFGETPSVEDVNAFLETIQKI